jgi:hypothetical protein
VKQITTPTDGNPIEATDAVIEQLALVRASGLVNMMDRRSVREAAEWAGHDALVAFCADLDSLRVTDRGTIWMAALDAMVVSR